jgi:hypothetical protein
MEVASEQALRALVEGKPTMVHVTDLSHGRRTEKAKAATA